jgi:ankyrin repeat protein
LYQNSKIQQVVVCDDICGKYYADRALIQEWIRYEEDLKLIFHNSDIKLLLSSRLIVAQDEHFNMMSFLAAFTFNLCSPQYRFSLIEKKSMLKMHLAEDEEIEVSNDSIESQDCFPLLCELFGENELLRRNPDNFFSHPFEEYGKDLEKLKINHPLKYCSLALLIMFEDSIDENLLNDLEIDCTIQEKIDSICEVVGTPRGTSRYKIKEELESLENIYCRKIDGKIKSLHDKMFDFLSATIGPTLGQCLLRYSSCSFIRERIRLSSALQNDDENVIILPDILEHLYFKRMFEDILQGKIRDVFFNKQMQQTTFEEAMIREMSQLSEKKFNNLIKMEGDYPQNSTFLQRSKSLIDPISILGKMADDLDEVAKFHLTYAYSLLYQGNTCTFHWLLARGLHRVFIYVENRMPEFVKQKILENYNLCISLSILEERTEILRDIFTKYPHDSSDADEDDKIYYPLFLFVCFTGNLELVKYLHSKNQIYPTKTETGESAVWIASFANQLDVLKFLVSKNFDVNSVNNMNATPLFIAAQRGHIDVVDYLLCHDADVNICKTNETSPLFVACQEGHTEIVSLLLKYKADVNKYKIGKASSMYDVYRTRENLVRGRGLSPLFVACKNGHLEIVQLLLNHQASLELCTENGKTPLLVALQNEHIDISCLLIQKGANVDHRMDSGLNPLTVVSGNGQINLVHTLLENGALVNVCVANTDGNFNSHVDGGVENTEDNYDVIENTDNNIPSPLIMATMNDHLDVAIALLKKGSDINYRGVEGATALFEATQKGNFCMVKYLLSKKASINIATHQMRTPLFVAVQGRFENIVELLLDNKADVNLCRKDGVSPLFMAALRNHKKIVQLLLNYKADPNIARIHDNLYPLMCAAKLGNQDNLKLLIQSDALVNCKNKHGQTPLWTAVYNSQVECVQCLLENNADRNAVDDDGESVLLTAVRIGNMSIIQSLITSGSDVNLQNHEGISPLIRAVQCQNLEVVVCLLGNGVDINVKTREGKSALTFAVDITNKDIVTVLLRYHSDVNISDNQGQTILWKAVIQGDIDIVTNLLEHGANFEISFRGKTLLDLAKEMGHVEISKLLAEKQTTFVKCCKTLGWVISLYSKISDV